MIIIIIVIIIMINYYHFHHHHYILFFLLYALSFLYISYKVPLVLSVSRPWRHWSWGKDVSLLTELWVICGLFQGDRLIFWSSQMLALPYVMSPVNKFFQSLLYNTSDETLMTIWYHFCLHDPVIPRSLYLYLQFLKNLNEVFFQAGMAHRWPRITCLKSCPAANFTSELLVTYYLSLSIK